MPSTSVPSARMTLAVEPTCSRDNAFSDTSADSSIWPSLAMRNHGVPPPPMSPTRTLRSITNPAYGARMVIFSSRVRRSRADRGLRVGLRARRLGGKPARLDLFLREHAGVVEILDPRCFCFCPLGLHRKLVGERCLLLDLRPQQRVVESRQRLAARHPDALLDQHFRHAIAVEIGEHRRVFARHERAGRDQSALNGARRNVTTLTAFEGVSGGRHRTVLGHNPSEPIQYRRTATAVRIERRSKCIVGTGYL